MYYKILEQVFNQDELYASKRTIDLLDDFIRKELNHGFINLNPYKFSSFSNITVKHSIQLFLFYTNDDCLFEPYLIIDCPYCNEPNLFFEQDQEFIECEECRREYLTESAQKKVYVLFRLKDFIKVPKTQNYFSIKNPYSTHQILQTTTESLKKGYPLSSEEENEDKGNKQHPNYFEVEEANHMDGVPISNSFNNLKLLMFSEGLT